MNTSPDDREIYSYNTLLVEQAQAGDAETISFDDFVKFNGEQGAKEAGKMRSEGKDYVVKDGDLLNFLFNV